MKYLAVLLMISPLLLAREVMVVFNFVDAPLQLAVERLGQQAGVDVRVDQSIDERITLETDPIPWNEALARIKSKFNLTEQRKEGVLWLVRQKPENETIEPLTEKRLPQSEQMPPQRPKLLRLYRLKHYSAEKMAAMITERKNTLFNSLVYAQADAGQNTMIVRADSLAHKNIERIIDSLDNPGKQIRIAGRIIVARNQATEELGVRLGSRSISGYWGIAGGSRGVFNTQSPTSFSDNLILDLGINQNPAIRGVLGFNDGTSLIELELQALESSGKIDIVASPQVTVQSGSPAIIATGTEIPYSQIVDDNVDILFKEALLKLEVTPTLVSDNRIHMNIIIRLDNLGQQYNGIPSIDTNKLDTQVTLNSNQTLILGGIFRTLSSQSQEKVPLLGDLPILGALFRHDAKTQEKAELMVFITPSLDTTADQLINR